MVGHDSRLFDLGTRGWEAHTFLCLEEGAKPEPGVSAFTSSQSVPKCCKTKTWRCVGRLITYVFWNVITYCKTSFLSDLNQAVPNPQDGPVVYLFNAFDSRLRGDLVPLGSSPTKSQKKTFRVGSPQLPFSISSSFILFFVLLPFFLNTKFDLPYLVGRAKDRLSKRQLQTKTPNFAVLFA